MEFVLSKFSSANIKLSEIPHTLLSTNVAGMIPFNLGSTAQSILFSQILNHVFNSSDVS
jgi:hypothetical protein